MRTPLFRITQVLLLTILTSTLLLGCSSSSETLNKTETAKCMAKKLSPERMRQMGEGFALSEDIGLTRWDSWGCDAFVPGFFDEKLRAGLADELSAELVPQAAFREGVYAGTGTRGLSRKQRVVFGKLGAALEHSALEQERAVRCNFAEPMAVALVGQLDFPFSMAVIGVQADIGQADLVKGFATQLLSTAQTMSQALPKPECESVNKESFLEYARMMQKFYQGTHPWALGCGVRSEQDDLVLVCSGTGAKSEK